MENSTIKTAIKLNIHNIVNANCEKKIWFFNILKANRNVQKTQQQYNNLFAN